MINRNIDFNINTDNFRYLINLLVKPVTSAFRNIAVYSFDERKFSHIHIIVKNRATMLFNTVLALSKKPIIFI